MKLLLALLLLTLPMVAALNDPGAGLACVDGQGGYVTQAANPYLSTMDGVNCARKIARVVPWRNAYAGMTDEERTLQAVDAVEDMYDGACLLNLVRNLSDEPAMSVANARLWVGDRLNALGSAETLDWLDDQCPPPTSFPSEPDDQGEIANKLIVFRTEALLNNIRRRWPVLPRVGNVPPLVWAGTSHRVCTLAGGGTIEFFESRHPFHEAHLHTIHAIVAGWDQANGTNYLTRVYFVDSEDDLPCVSIDAPTP